MYMKTILQLSLAIVLIALRPYHAEAQVQSSLSGKITVKADLDPAQNFEGFEVLVGYREEDGAKLDTLGYAKTKADGSFAMQVKARERGIYPLMIFRRDRLITTGELVVGQGDVAQMSIQLPSANMRIISAENAAWMALKNTRIQHKQSLLEAIKEGKNQEKDLQNIVGLTANLLWDLDTSFPAQTVGAQLAKVESVSMLIGWNDSLAVARAKQIPNDNPGYVEMTKNLRRAYARTKGQEAAIHALEAVITALKDPNKQAPLYAEIIMARLDSLQADKALAAIQDMRTRYSNTDRWKTWLDNVEYEVKHLLPGLEAPHFNFKTITGQPLTKETLKGKIVVLEFWSPRDAVYPEQLNDITTLNQAYKNKNFAWISVAMEPDMTVYEAFKQNRELPALQVVERNGTKSEAAKAYNVNYVPVRFIIDADGKLVGKFLGNAVGSLAETLARLVKS